MTVVEETSAGVVVYRQAGESPREYLLLHSAHGFWEFAKGHLEAGERVVDAALRELAEEAGLTGVAVVPGFARQITYHFKGRGRRHEPGSRIHKTVHFLLARTPEAADVRISDEHRGFAFLPFDRAVRQLTHAGTRAVLRDADAYLDASP